jgi:16S rRNA (cytidine1402-2'-O)-methyltransferase
MATLYVVSTPIGNLEDITLRALRVLKEVDLILCEDTRVTKKLLSRYDIKTPVLSYHEHSVTSKINTIAERIEAGKHLALVTDAGTPSISDPGSFLLTELRARFSDMDLSIVSVPGPSALTAALSLSSFSGSDFLFLGFLPHKKGRETLFREIAASERVTVFYESPHRLQKTLASLKQHLASDRQLMVARELTKMHEQTIHGTAREVEAYFLDHTDKVRGEIVIVVSGAK